MHRFDPRARREDGLSSYSVIRGHYVCKLKDMKKTTWQRTVICIYSFYSNFSMKHQDCIILPVLTTIYTFLEAHIHVLDRGLPGIQPGVQLVNN